MLTNEFESTAATSQLIGEVKINFQIESHHIVRELRLTSKPYSDLYQRLVSLERRGMKITYCSHSHLCLLSGEKYSK